MENCKLQNFTDITHITKFPDALCNEYRPGTVPTLCTGYRIATSMQTNEPRHEKTNVLHMRKQRRRSASR